MKDYLRRIHPKGECPPRKPWRKIAWSWLGSFLGIYAVTVGGQVLDNLLGVDAPILIGAFGASAVLIYGLPMAELAQPRNFVGGYLVCALTGVGVAKLMPDPAQHALAAALAVSVAVLLMHVTRTLHPPGGAVALIAVIGNPKVQALGFRYVLCPVLSGALIMLAVALLVNNLSGNPKRHYPLYWW